MTDDQGRDQQAEGSPAMDVEQLRAKIDAVPSSRERVEQLKDEMRPMLAELTLDEDLDVALRRIATVQRELHQPDVLADHYDLAHSAVDAMSHLVRHVERLRETVEELRESLELYWHAIPEDAEAEWLANVKQAEADLDREG